VLPSPEIFRAAQTEANVILPSFLLRRTAVFGPIQVILYERSDGESYRDVDGGFFSEFDAVANDCRNLA
jgi:hypothetical protein